MKDLIIRKATIEDAAGIAKVQLLGWQRAYRGQMPDEYLDTLSIEKKIENGSRYY